jgi:phenylpropionate dioxygenase-like ring-hydroxylating dioxygenase large terminal subunit
MTLQNTAFKPVSRDEVAWLGTDPVPAEPYYDPAYFEREREAIFLRSWLQIGHLCELPEPNSFIRRDVEIARASVLIMRDKNGTIRAFHNACTHRGTQLTNEACGRQANFSCPYHRWSFGLDGELLAAPDFEAFNLTKADGRLKEIALETCAGLIFINFAKQPAQNLRAWLGPLAEKLETLPIVRATTFSEYVYDIEANWKLTYDNFQENYHLRFIHPRSGEATIAADNPFGYPVRYAFHGPHRTQTIWTNPAPKIHTVQSIAFAKGVACAVADGLMNTNTGRDYFALFPNFFLLGSPLQHFSHTVMPISASKSRGVIRLYWIGESESASESFAREYAMASARDIHAEDRAVIEAGQRGLNSGALTHIHFQTQEALCRHLFNSVHAAVKNHLEERGRTEAPQ